MEPVPHHLVASSAAGTDPLAEGGDHLLGGRELDAALAPGGDAGLRPRLVEAPRGVLDEDDAPAALEEAADRGVVADVGRDAEDDDLVRVERLEQRLGVRVREDVEVLLQEQELPPALDQARDEPGRERNERERQRVALLRLEDLLGAARAAQAVRRKRVAEVGRVRDLGIGQLVVVGGGDVDEPGRAARRRRAAPSPARLPRRPGRRACPTAP